MLAYCGYGVLKAADIERLDSDVLMDFNRLRHRVSNGAEFAAAFPTAFGSDDILSTRFFSPKTNGCVGIRQTVAIQLCEAPCGSEPAPVPMRKKAGVDNMYLLGNIYEADLTKNPFNTPSKNNQVILTTPKTKCPMYWLVFGPVDKGGLRQDYSETSWDATDPDLPTVATADGRPARPLKRYFVPDGCVQCHRAGELRQAEFPRFRPLSGSR